MLWLLIGAGVSTLGATRLLRLRGHSVRVCDRKEIRQNLAEQFRHAGAEVIPFSERLDLLNYVDAILVSPSVPTTHPLLVMGRSRGLRVFTDIDLALENYAGHIVGVTGTNGKSTVVSMVAHILNTIGLPAAAGGNLGDPPSLMVAEGRMKPNLVLELSSYQLEHCAPVRPSVAIFTSFSTDHLARHGSLENYFRAKWRLLESMPKDSLSLFSRSVLEYASKFNCFGIQGQRFTVGDQGTSLPWDIGIDRNKVLHAPLLQDDVSLASLPFQEPHNLLNAAFAIVATQWRSHRPAAELCEALRTFKGLPFRCETVGEYGGFPIVNDSKSTNVESVLVALEGTRGPLTLLCGGKAKEESFEPVAEHHDKIHRLIAFGASGDKIARDLKGKVPVELFPTLTELLKGLSTIIQECRGPLLFSPGGASFDEFDNFEHRGRVFTDAVREALVKLHDGSRSNP